MPGIWYQVGLQLGDRFFRGASLPGMPGVYMGQNNDVCWTFTNVMADVQDLFVERIEGDALPVRGRVAAAGDRRGGDRRQGPRRAGAPRGPRAPTTARSSTRRSAPTRPSRWRCAGSALDQPASPRRILELLEIAHRRRSWSSSSRATPRPVSNLIWADRHGSIGYKLIGRLPLRARRLPGPAEAGLDRRVRVGGHGPLRRAAGGGRPRERLPRHRQQPDRRRRLSRTTSPATGSTATARGGSRSCSTATRRARPRRLRGDADRQPLDPRARGGAPARPPAPARPARDARDRAAAQLGRAARPRLDRRRRSTRPSCCASPARSRARAIGDRDLSERWLDRADNGFIAHVTSPWRWHSHLMALWEEGDEELIGRPWDELALDALRGALDDLADRFGPDPEGWRWGRVHELEFPHPLGDANPLLAPAPQPPPRGRRRPGDGQPDRLRPQRPLQAIWAPSWRMVADPAEPERSRWQLFTGQSGHPGSPHYDDLQAAWLDGRTQPMAGEGALERYAATRSPGAVSRRGPDQAHRRRAARAARVRAGRDRLQPSARAAGRTRCRCGSRASRDGRDLDLDLREVAEGQQPRTRPAGDAAGRDRATSTSSCAASRSRPRPSSIRDLETVLGFAKELTVALRGGDRLDRGRRGGGARGAGAEAGRDPLRADAHRHLGPPQARRHVLTEPHRRSTRRR